MELTRITDQPIQQHPIIVLPIIYDIGNQVTQMVERRDVTTPMFIIQAANGLLRKFLEKRGVPTTESSLYAAIHDLLTNLTLQIVGQQQIPMQGGPYMQGNIGPMTGPPNQQIPLQQMGQVSQMGIPRDHQQQVMNQQAMGQPMDQGYGGMSQMSGPSND